MDNRWYVIVNPHAGSKKARADWPEIRKILIKKNFDFESVYTERRYHATELTIQAIEGGYRHLIVVGGDGTLNEVVNGVFKQTLIPTTDITIGVVSVGTGNDWGRMYKMPSKYKKQIKVIRKGNTILQDVGQVTHNYADEAHKHFFINIAGMGFDALVAKKTNIAKQRGIGGAFMYLLNLVIGLFQFNHNIISIKNGNNIIFSGKVFSMSIGICSYNGGGMKQLPMAIPDDGLFDVTVIRKISKVKIVRNIGNLYDGSFLKLKEVETFTGSEFEVISTPKCSLYLETDGESLGNSPLYFRIIPKAARLIIKKK